MKYLFTVIIIFVSILCCRFSYGQQTTLQSLFAGSDSSAVMDSIMRDFDAFLDSVSQPQSFVNVSAGVGTGFFSFQDNTSFEFNTKKVAILSPSVSYFHKSGLGISFTTYIMNENRRLRSYQYAVSPSFDYVTNKNFSAGMAFTKYYTRKNLSFYYSHSK